MARGRAASLVEVAKAIVAGSATAEMKRRMGTLKIRAAGNKTREDEGDQGGVEGEQELAEVDHDADAHVADGEGHGCADPDGSEVHDDIGETEHDFGEGFGEAEDGAAFGVWEGGEGDAEEDGEDGDLEDLALGDGLGDVFGEDVEEKVVPAEWGGDGDGFMRCGRKSQANSGVGDVDGDETYYEGEGGWRLRSK